MNHSSHVWPAPLLKTAQGRPGIALPLAGLMP
jgi:hypothetical protein